MQVYPFKLRHTALQHILLVYHHFLATSVPTDPLLVQLQVKPFIFGIEISFFNSERIEHGNIDHVLAGWLLFSLPLILFLILPYFYKLPSNKRTWSLPL